MLMIDRYSGLFKHGKIHDENAELHYANGNLEFKGAIIVGKKSGMGTHYHTEGDLKSSGVYRDGKLIKDMTHTVSNQEKQLAKTKVPKKTFSKTSKFPTINFNIDTTYMEKIVKGKSNSYYRNFPNKGDIDIENFIQFHKKNEFVSVYDEVSKVLRFEGIIFVSKKQSNCSFYNTNGKLVKREPYLNGKKLRSGMKFHANGKMKHRGNFSSALQTDSGFCIQYHANGTISRVGEKCGGVLTDTFAEFYNCGTPSCVRLQTPGLSSNSGKERYGEEGVMFWPDGSFRHRGISEAWGWGIEDEE